MNDKEYFDRRQNDHTTLRKAYPKFKPDVVGQLQTVLDAARINTKQFITDAKDDKIIKGDVYEVLRGDREHVWSLNEFVTERYVTIVQPLIDIIGYHRWICGIASNPNYDDECHEPIRQASIIG